MVSDLFIFLRPIMDSKQSSNVHHLVFYHHSFLSMTTDSILDVLSESSLDNINSIFTISLANICLFSLIASLISLIELQFGSVNESLEEESHESAVEDDGLGET